MITSVTMDYDGVEHAIRLGWETGRLEAKVSTGGRVVKTVALPEASPDEAVLALLHELDAREVQRLTKREEFVFRRRRYSIDIWPVGKYFKTRVYSDEGESEVVSWRNDGQFDDLKELFEVMKDQIRLGSVEFSPPPLRDYWS